MKTIILTIATIIMAFVIGCGSNPVNNAPIVDDDVIVNDTIRFEVNPKDTLDGYREFPIVDDDIIIVNDTTFDDKPKDKPKIHDLIDYDGIVNDTVTIYNNYPSPEIVYYTAVVYAQETLSQKPYNPQWIVTP